METNASGTPRSTINYAKIDFFSSVDQNKNNIVKSYIHCRFGKQMEDSLRGCKRIHFVPFDKVTCHIIW